VVLSGAMQEALRMARIFHNDPSIPVLIEGETGTGKEIIARYIHFGTEGVDTPLWLLIVPHSPRPF
jgi:DNA-binding NtrC family response regulator